MQTPRFLGFDYICATYNLSMAQDMIFDRVELAQAHEYSWPAAPYHANMPSAEEHPNKKMHKLPVILSLSNAARLSFSDLCILLFLFLSLCRLCVCVFLCSHWSLVDVPLIFFCPADHVPDWQPRVLLGMVEARSVNVKKTTTTRTVSIKIICPINHVA